MYPTRRQYDTFVFEHVLKQRFWILGACLLVFWIATLPWSKTNAHAKTIQADRFDNAFNNETKSTTLSSTTPAPRQPFFTARVSRFLTTRLRKSLALAMYTVVFGGQLLESYWVIVTLGRVTIKLFLNWPTQGTWGVQGALCLTIG